MERLREIARKVLAYAKEAGAEAAQCSVRESKTKEFNVDGGEFSLMRTLFDESVSVTLIKDRKQGAVAVNRFDEESIRTAVADAAAAAESAAPDEAWEIDQSGKKESFVKGCPECDTEKLFGRTKELLETIRERFPKLVIDQMITDHESGKSIYCNSFGTCYETVYGAYEFYVGYSAKEGETGSHTYGSSGRVDNLDKPFIECAMTEKELTDTEAQSRPEPMEGKFTGTVVFTPECLREVVFDTILSQFISDRALIEGTGAWKDRIGEAVASPAFSFSLAPNDPRIICGARYTPEGYPAEDFDVIRDGILKSFVLSQYGANKTGKKRSGNTTASIVCEAGETPLAEIIAGVKRGIVIGRFSGGQPTANGEFSGVAKNSFLIENGKITKALSETMVSANLYEMLHKLRAVSREVQENGSSVVPYIAFDGVTVSGK
ncbi:MAG: TldD/PmbA family protein [Lachnospiraceae bacterium]|nr:TldD/PmbA family protein [Lachnospiraceae bacterium]